MLRNGNYEISEPIYCHAKLTFTFEFFLSKLVVRGGAILPEWEGVAMWRVVRMEKAAL